MINAPMTKPEQFNVTRPMIKIWKSATENETEKKKEPERMGQAAFVSSLSNMWRINQNKYSVQPQLSTWLDRSEQKYILIPN